MAIIESTGGTALAVDPGFGAARMSVRPPEVTGWISLGATSGAIGAVGAGNTLFSLRNLSANLLFVRRIGIGFVVTTGYTVAQAASFGLFVARAFTTSDSGGTAIGLTGNNGKHRSALSTLTSVDARIAATAAMTPGVKVMDANALAVQHGYAAGVGTVIAPAPANLISHDTGDYPIVLSQNEGINIQTLIALGAGGAGTLIVNLEIAEAVAF